MADNSHSDPTTLWFAVNRLGYGVRAEEYGLVLRQGLGGWLDEQISAPPGDDVVVQQQLAACKWHIKYDASEGKWQAVDEMRPLTTLNQPIEEAWKTFDPQHEVNGQERARPRQELIAATLIRSVYSRYQLREVMAQFWHDHFHVNAFADDHIAAAMAVYDHDVIRKHCFGNFRAMLEAVATSTAMQYYLSNHSSRAGAANENYARELFELHTLGRENYLNDHYDRWKDVPGAKDGNPVGYIDQDVYEAARAFTGWTIEDGAGIDNVRKLPATGKFTYVENWHDGYQKRVLATDFDPFTPPMADGRKVLDLIAEHPATIRHMSRKLCVRLIGPYPPEALIGRVAAAWQKTVHAPDQIAQMVRLIVLSPEFAQSRGSKVKRPIALMASFVRMMGYDFTPTEGIYNQMAAAGQRLFSWPTPTGLPDNNAIFLGSNAMRNRWNMLLGLAQNWWNTGLPNPEKTLIAWNLPAGNEIQGTVQWFRLFGTPPDGVLDDAVMKALNVPPMTPIHGSDPKKSGSAAAIAAMAPDFQVT